MTEPMTNGGHENYKRKRAPVVKRNWISANNRKKIIKNGFLLLMARYDGLHALNCR